MASDPMNASQFDKNVAIFVGIMGARVLDDGTDKAAFSWGGKLFSRIIGTENCVPDYSDSYEWCSLAESTVGLLGWHKTYARHLLYNVNTDWRNMQRDEVSFLTLMFQLLNASPSFRADALYKTFLSETEITSPGSSGPGCEVPESEPDLSLLQ